MDQLLTNLTLHTMPKKFTKCSPSCHAPHVLCIKRPTFCQQEFLDWEIPRYSLLLKHQAWACCSGSFDIDGVELASPGPDVTRNASRSSKQILEHYQVLICTNIIRLYTVRTRNSQHICYESMTKVQNCSKSSCALPNASLSASSQFFPKCSLLVR